jgi:hypothetical protein
MPQVVRGVETVDLAEKQALPKRTIMHSLAYSAEAR